MIVELWTDGASTGKVGPGGWAYLFYTKGQMVIEDGEVYEGTTNMRMEMEAVVRGLDEIFELCGPSDVKVYCDNSVVVKGIKHNWLMKWKKRGMKTTSGSEVANQDLWLDLESAIARHDNVQMVKVKGHTKSSSRAAIGNRRVDNMARKARKRASQMVRESV